MAKRLQILALSGGGFRGLFTTSILVKVEALAGRPLRDCFDLVAGTSIGGLLASGIALGIPAADLHAAMLAHGPRIFDKRLRLFGRRLPLNAPRLGLLSSRYSQAGLAEAIDKVLGDTAIVTSEGAGKPITLGEVHAPLMIVAVNRQAGTPTIFKSDGVDGARSGVTVRDAVLATSAAPTFFPEHKVLGQNMIDGGLIANAPDILAILELIAVHGASPDDLSVMSIGTAGSGVQDIPRDPSDHGVLGWMLPSSFSGRDLFKVTLSAQEVMATRIAERLLRGRYVRIDKRPATSQGDYLGPDKADQTAATILVDLADHAWTEMSSADKARAEGMARHQAHWLRPAPGTGPISA
jgi:patatin-like phospholipase/acyl hydrolase